MALTADSFYGDPARSDHAAEWWQEIAAAVIRQALIDARTRGRYICTQDVADAVEFLQGQDGRLAFWCEVSGLPLQGVRELAQQALGEGWRPPKAREAGTRALRAS